MLNRVGGKPTTTNTMDIEGGQVEPEYRFDPRGATIVGQ
jgi:hypothetical protein